MHNLLDSLPATLPLIQSGTQTWSRPALQQRIAQLRMALLARRAPRAPVAILADNCPDWLAIDLCTQELGITLVPLPLFFTPGQWMHVIAESGVQSIFCAQPQQAGALGFPDAVACEGELRLCEGPLRAHLPLPDDVQKITFTSGTTSTPKGVCLSTGQQWEVARALHDGLCRLGVERHLCLLPFAVLLENIAGPYTAMLSGATTICPPLAETGLLGASQFDPQVCLDAIARYQANSIILLPQMLQALVAVAAPDEPRIRSLKFVAVGGAKTPARLIRTARAKGFPVYEGYGLSECSSVVALNLPGAEREGSVGRPLAHRQLRIAADGEIEVGGARARYLGQAATSGAWLGTGDLGHLDADGFLFIDGRKKDILITGFGRNVSPEWPEAALLGTGRIAQAVVVGDGQASLGALIVPLSAQLGREQIQAAVDQANADLPDYARVLRWMPVPPMSSADGLVTANGRPRRPAIHLHFQQQIASLFTPAEQTT
ncbi:AMP-binding protein [Massilia rubra]|uniref:Long-chain fatty acid--CoA ligase n=1 Tax=Massilia rubra TaxID=2607910 RepID=A0ABX0M265_9BURK|nr:AMP-binding protein [Massilia rubra]NHZ38302.1 long-chain fatty acid--CoA ligase [Massilia rubra]